MTVLLFEWFVGGGLPANETIGELEGSILSQGLAMFTGLANDWIDAGHRVIAPLDGRLLAKKHPALQALIDRPAFTPQEIDTADSLGLPNALVSIADHVDAVFLIAPETDGCLERCYLWCRPFEAKVVSASRSLMELCVDKNRSQSFLHRQNVAVPAGFAVPADFHAIQFTAGDRSAGGVDLHLPWIAKPADGAGAEHCWCGNRVQQLSQIDWSQHRQWRIEQLIPGQAVSVAMARNQTDTLILPPTRQIFSPMRPETPVGGAAANLESTAPEAWGHYVSAAWLEPPELQRRAVKLAHQVNSVLPQWQGYIGVDMVLSEQSPDVVVEINPRLTMSYDLLRTNHGRQIVDALAAIVAPKATPQS